MSIDTLFSLGSDALSNEFDIILPPFPGVIDLTSTVIRTMKFELPEYSVNTYTVDYKTQKFTKPSGKNNTPNQFTFDFRIDKYWKVYEGMENWLNIVLNQDTGSMGSDGIAGTASSIRIPIDVIPVDHNGNTTKKGWTFTGCFISGLTGVSFDQSLGDALTATATIQFVKKLVRV
jgi:hypothetical protein